ncbi:MAG: LysM peptidoglycan-binding domain-containing protein [Thermoleophilaceae bacterium]
MCRQERLFGTLPAEPVVSRRAQAVLAGGVLALSSAAPGAALAQEPDQQLEGVAAPEQPAGAELDDPGFDPGGETALPFEAAPVPTSPTDGESDAGDGAPLEAEPSEDLDARLVPLAETETPATDGDAPVPPAEAVSPAPDVPPGGAPVPDPGVGALPPAPSTEEHSRAEDESERAPGPSKDKAEAEGPDAGGPAPPAGASGWAGGGSQLEVLPAADETAVVAYASSVAPDPPQGSLRGARFHVVEPGDSLWSIAKRLLGREASPARIAREVNRLWSLNEGRIGTGDPDLLMVGTKLRLR